MFRSRVPAFKSGGCDGCWFVTVWLGVYLLMLTKASPRCAVMTADIEKRVAGPPPAAKVTVSFPLQNEEIACRESSLFNICDTAQAPLKYLKEGFRFWHGHPPRSLCGCGGRPRPATVGRVGRATPSPDNVNRRLQSSDPRAPTRTQQFQADWGGDDGRGGHVPSTVRRRVVTFNKARKRGPVPWTWSNITQQQ